MQNLWHAGENSTRLSKSTLLKKNYTDNDETTHICNTYSTDSVSNKNCKIIQYSEHVKRELEITIM
uniref:Uncharacterized protein n=1 Tax=Arundo donax TaxID=35708 RepID=A0A0A9F1A6_ARUDO